MEITVRQGDSLWYYSQLFQIPAQLVYDSNRNINPSQITAGQTIQIPGFTVSEYTVESGDTFWSLAARRNLNADALSLLNPAVNPQQLTIGQRLLLPARVTWRVVDGQEAYNYEAMNEDINQLINIYPFLMTETIGNSVMGKNITEIRVGRGAKQVHTNSSFHANEWITTPVMMWFLNDYLLAVTNNGSIANINMPEIYNNVLWSIVPMVNPDGVNLVLNGLPEQEPYRSEVLEINGGSRDFSGWKANIRGVDLNNQFPAKWEIEKARKRQVPSPRDYPGPFPLSEPEAQAMAELTRSMDFRRVNALHTQGEVIYWGFEDQEPPEAETIVQEYANVSGYLPIRTVESYAGYKDWFIQEWNRPGFTIELGRGTNPLPLSQFNQIYRAASGILLANLYM
ncbi:M14 family metallopeptidase [Sediminibacillus albus]|uniref:G-D-glutamyl-meso-diaminopimelate peptidase n=1 Tax=Sediminibacillus albus TaxID=407036 RepID=A0A1G8VRU2_9BACI|nr:M14 family metallopeptidase [Sediminibacillus albus]SDJ68752.1 g-D-glutamyl-meso-diaminopimelate peptidase [Sediminibacillus albus]